MENCWNFSRFYHWRIFNIDEFQSYMTIFNSDDLPEPKTILEAAVDAMNISYEQKAKEAYEKFMSSVVNFVIFEERRL